MSTIETDEFKTLLEEERARLVHAVALLHDKSGASLDDELGEIGSGASDNHLADTAGVAYDRELDLGLEEGAQQTVDEIDAALARIEDGSYGSCENCGKPIGEDRLRAIPWARLCIDDQRRTG
jgi:DnaK suppressor protein